MYDMHYDLLTYLYYKKGDVYTDTYKNNMKGGIINLYFMDLLSMEKELNITKEECLDVVSMFKKSLVYLEEYKSKNNINPKFVYSIEGCSYLNIDDLEELYNLGLRSITPVWNPDNKYGGGAFGVKRLTDDGKLLIKKAVELNMQIDLSHANEQTFNDIIDVLKEEQLKGNKIKVIASHSNIYTLNPHKRNLRDYQIKNLMEIGGKIGVVCYLPFLDSNYKTNSREENLYSVVKHINYLLNDLNVDKNNIFLSTDDMSITEDTFYEDTVLFELNEFASGIKNYLSNYFSEEDIKLFLEGNPLSVINNLC